LDALNFILMKLFLKFQNIKNSFIINIIENKFIMKKAKVFNFSSYVVLFLLAFILNSCKKDLKKDTDTKTAEDLVWAVTAYTDVFNQLDLILKDSSIVYANSIDNVFRYGCISLSMSEFNSFPKIITLDFGGNNCLGKDSRTRRGKIIVQFSGPLYKENTFVKVSFINYYISDTKIDGKFTIEAQKGIELDNNYSQIVYLIKVQDGHIEGNKGESFFSANFTREWNEGMETQWPNLNDDLFSITGSGKGISANKEDYEFTITIPLSFQHNCNWISKGNIDAKVYAKENRKIDYGSGCDNEAKLTIGNESSDLTLK